MVSTTFSFTSAILVLGLALMVSCQQEEVKPPAEEGPVLVNGEEVSTRPPLTGIPQIDYIWDPNLPHELNGYNLSSYPFYRRVPPPDKMEFECDGLHDGFYASVVHKCQVYHQCLFGLRYDFLCANFTAFDQKNFICHFANEVDCDNSPKFFDRNEALYKTTSTTPLPTPPPIVVRTRFVDEEGRPVRRPGAGRFRRPNGKRRPVYYDDYYDYDYQEYYDAPAEEEDPSLAGNSTATTTANKAEAPLEEEVAAPAKPVKAGGGRQQRPGAGQGNRLNIFNNNRPPPRIRPPVPNSEAKKPNKPTKPTTTTPPPAEEFEYVDYVDGELPVEEVATTTTTTTTPPPPPKRRFRRPKTTTTPAPVVEEFVDDAFFEEEEFVEPATTTQRPRRPKVSGTRRQSTTEAATVTTTTATTTTTAPAVEEEPAPIELPSRRNSALFNRRTSVNNLLKRKSNNAATSSTTTLPDDILNEEEFVDEPVEEVVAEVTTTSTTTSTTTAAPTRRTTKARPSRPANTARTRPTEAPIFVEEEAPVTTAPAVVEAKQAPLEVVEPLPILEEAPLPVRGRVRRPQSPARVEEEVAAPVAPVVAPAVNRRGSQRRVPQPPVIAEAEVEVAAEEENVRQGRDLLESSRTVKTVLEESTNFDEDLGESQQWSIINLFSRVYPHRA